MAREDGGGGAAADAPATGFGLLAPEAISAIATLPS